MDRWKNLASAVVITAVDDYRNAHSRRIRSEIREEMRDNPFMGLLNMGMTFDDIADEIERQERAGERNGKQHTRLEWAL